MHELSLAMSILSIVADEAGKARAAAVSRIRLCVGELACVEAETLTACLEMVAEGTVAHKARLEVRRIPATGVCLVCGSPATGSGSRLSCPVCRPGSVRLATGRELYVESIDVQPPTQVSGHVEPRP